MILPFRFLKLSVFVLLLASLGCSDSGNLGNVEGVVTIDGKPVSDASVTFYPITGRASVGYTDSNGHYTLGYTRTSKGAEIGDHKVTITTELTSDYNPKDGQNRATVTRKEILPATYGDRKKTELTAAVTAGNNVFDFELKSE